MQQLLHFFGAWLKHYTLRLLDIVHGTQFIEALSYKYIQDVMRQVRWEGSSLEGNSFN